VGHRPAVQAGRNFGLADVPERVQAGDRLLSYLGSDLEADPSRCTLFDADINDEDW